MRRLAISLFALCSLMLQTTSFAWTPHAKAASDDAPPAQVQMEHCHGDEEAPAQAADCCCPDGQCDCVAMCAAASVALPATHGGLADLIRAHFAATRLDDRPLPPSAATRFRPPISSAS
jgi:hypothetical protein